MKKFLERLFIKIVMPLLAVLLEEAVKLVFEAVGDETLSNRDKVRYVLGGVSEKIEEMYEQF